MTILVAPVLMGSVMRKRGLRNSVAAFGVVLEKKIKIFDKWWGGVLLSMHIRGIDCESTV
ncbi:MAG: hypothetical protein UY44_C0017G0031 [Candidatus Kaiserbacteria bacterium GW2011_GWA2_49_19]|uniref:Uncharacterized protein n=1 Tax=Candidatus Kaiserbacteria bacterium GW2011_GWA2_49_19 TaxID=1618669 RepID=A0A0G1VNZ7_9BACT|nr:MAG: hypothetical protein UY44_C0017G0031 [Candidatus Kaiserbacteria bacterium GW2011_GWA2_49_19]